jgi:hypothetical protein
MFSRIAISGSAVISVPSRKECKNRPLLAIAIGLFGFNQTIVCLSSEIILGLDAYRNHFIITYTIYKECAQQIHKPGCCLDARSGWQRSPSAGHPWGLWGTWWMLKTTIKFRPCVSFKIQQSMPHCICI